MPYTEPTTGLRKKRPWPSVRLTAVNAAAAWMFARHAVAVGSSAASQLAFLARVLKATRFG